jgi:flagella basal body P-ring formation protein FlgA
VLGDAAEAEGLFARGSIAAAAPIRRQDVMVPPAVHRGDVVLLVAQRAGLRITTPGEVREDAALSQSVRVVNRSSRKELTGRVLDASTVVVDF